MTKLLDQIEFPTDLRKFGRNKLKQISDCDLLSIGQYIKPTPKHAKVEKWYKPEEFNELRDIGLELGFKGVVAGPLVRSSYKADEQYYQAKGLIPIN